MPNRAATYLLSPARIQKADGDELVIAPASAAWLTPWLGGGLFGLIGILVLFNGRESFLMGLLILALAAFFVAAYPTAISITFDLSRQEMLFSADYLLRRPRHVSLQAPLAQLAKLDFRPTRWGKRHVVEVALTDGARIVLDFGRRTAEAEQLVQRFAAIAGTAAAPLLNTAAAVTSAANAETQATTKGQLRSWSVWLLIMGGAQMVAASGFSTWGALLIGVGLASFYFAEASMFVVYAVTVAWAGLSNMLYGAAVWKVFALFQGLLAYQLLQQFRRSHRVEQAAPPSSERTRAERLFPWLALLLGGGSLVGLVVTLAGVLGNIFWFHNQALPGVLGVVETIAVNTGLVGCAAGLAGWLAAYRRRWACIIGFLTGGLTLVAEIGIGVWAKF